MNCNKSFNGHFIFSVLSSFLVKLLGGKLNQRITGRQTLLVSELITFWWERIILRTSSSQAAVSLLLVPWGWWREHHPA
jgi:hypothetical protein